MIVAIIIDVAIMIRESPSLSNPTDSRYSPARSGYLATSLMVRASSPKSEKIMNTMAKERAKLYWPKP